MLDVSHVLQRLNISQTSLAMATSEVGILVRDSLDPLYTASKFLNDLVSIEWKFSEPIYAGLVCKYVVKYVVDHHCIIDPDTIWLLQQEANEYATAYCENPNNSYMWAKVDEDAIDNKSGHIQVATGIDTKVAVKSNGKIKKGGKAILAADMYQKFVVDSEVPLTNQGFIALLMKELDMGKAGATTYAYNQKKLHSQSLS
jgi:hypothetical protein